MTTLKDTFTSTGAKFFAHTEAMNNLRNGKGQPISCHVMLTDICNHSCAFCSVQARAGDSLAFDDVLAYLDILRRYGLKAVILSGGGNPILYKCKKTGKNFNDVVDAIHGRGLEIGLITNGMPIKSYLGNFYNSQSHSFRHSWGTVRPETLDKLAWIRLSLAGLDHVENECYVPDIDPSKTTLGFSYVGHDLYDEPADPHHGKVSTEADLITLDRSKCKPTWFFNDRVPVLTEQIRHYVDTYHPKYVRLLPNCLQPSLIAERVSVMQQMANAINPDVVFVQYKPPAAPNVCLLGAIHPVMNCDGYVYPCDSCVLNEEAGHAFANPWRICHWSEVAQIYEKPLRSFIDNPAERCPGCVFTQSNLLLEKVWKGEIETPAPEVEPFHKNFV